jgi:hypothetical protein
VQSRVGAIRQAPGCDRPAMDESSPGVKSPAGFPGHRKRPAKLIDRRVDTDLIFSLGVHCVGKSPCDLAPFGARSFQLLRPSIGPLHRSSDRAPACYSLM